MDLIKSVTRRTRVSEIVYTLLNVAYAGLLFFLVRSFDPPYLAFLVVILSKWRVFAVRPRFWFANVQANLIDAVVGFAVVTLMWAATDHGLVQFGIAALFAAWLLALKPLSKRFWVLIQAGIGQFLGLTALFTVAYAAPAVIVTIGAWIVGYATARHALSSFDDEHEKTFLAIVWALVVAELSWLAYHWTVAYQLSGELKLPQVALVASVFGFVLIKFYENLHHNQGNLKLQELRWPLIFGGALIVLLLLRFSGLDSAQL